MGQGRTRGARVYLRCFFRNEAAAGNNSTPDAGAAGPGAPDRVVETQVSAPIREESGILLANIEGLFPLRARHKIGVLREMADEGGIFMIALTESHLRKDILDAEITMEGFQHYRADRKEGRKKGGVIVYLRNSLARSTVELRSKSGNSDGFVEHVLLHIKKFDLCVAIVYRPPACPPENFNKTLKEIETRVAELGDPAPSLIIGGDFNLPRIRWTSPGGLEVGDRDTSQEAQLAKFAAEHLLSQQVRSPTRAHNILDLFFTNNERMVVDVRVEETSLSDHRLVMVETTIGIETLPRSIPQEGLAGLNFHNRRTDWVAIWNEINEIDWRAEFHEMNAAEIYTKLCEKLAQVCVRHTPRKTGPKVRSIPRDRRILMRKRKRLNKRISETTGDMRRQRLVDLHKEIELRLQDSHRMEKQAAEERVVEVIKENPKYFF